MRNIEKNERTRKEITRGQLHTSVGLVTGAQTQLTKYERKAYNPLSHSKTRKIKRKTGWDTVTLLVRQLILQYTITITVGT